MIITWILLLLSLFANAAAPTNNTTSASGSDSTNFEVLHGPGDGV